MIRLNNNWKFAYSWTDEIRTGKDYGIDVRLPHNVGEIPLHYASPEAYNTICGYSRTFELNETAGKRIFLQFDGAAHIAEVFINGQFAGKHYGGYTAFRLEITKLAVPGKNHLAVKLDCTENPEIPPFGHVVDYLAYGGLYRDVWLDIRPETYIQDIFVRMVEPSSVRIDVACSDKPEVLFAEITDVSGFRVASTASFQTVLQKDAEAVLMPACKYHAYAVLPVSNPRLWSLEDPYLYKCIITLRKNSEEDIQQTKFGMRSAEFKMGGFYLNHKKLFLRGLNRHQSYPYIGYAATESLQYEDARILKQELAVNAVRTSHYPQSPYFIDACDSLGLCVFTELPGWQHIGDEKWKGHALTMLQEMVLQYRNHPSIILWGVRINESVDDDAFYRETNAAAHKLDHTRQTSGVRYLQKSSLLEDVYAFNDFSYDGTTNGCLPKSEVTPDDNKPYLISECNGHMYPVKSFDNCEKRQEQALRHATVLNAAMSEEEIAGCFGWCMFDYATHQDFGSGDRVCYHGVLDQFRNPKTAAWLYASQGDKNQVLEVGSMFDIGEYPGGRKGAVYAFTNAQEVRLYKNDEYVNTFYPTAFPALPHSPVCMDDLIGNLIKKEEGFSDAQANLIRKLLLSADQYGFSHMPAKDKMLLLYAHIKYGLSFEDGYALYGKYFGNWGERSVTWRMDAVTDGKIMKSLNCSASSALHLDVKASSLQLSEGDVYDMALVRIRIADENRNTASYAQMPLLLEASGAIFVEGPERVTAEGGMCGTIIRTNGQAGTGELKITADPQYNLIEPVTLHFEVEGANNEDPTEKEPLLGKKLEGIPDKINRNLRKLMNPDNWPGLGN